VLASAALVVILPLQLAGLVTGAMGWPAWIPMLVFEITLGLWLLIKAVPAVREGSSTK
jgi:hypothetical protein